MAERGVFLHIAKVASGLARRDSTLLPVLHKHGSILKYILLRGIGFGLRVEQAIFHVMNCVPEEHASE